VWRCWGAYGSWQTVVEQALRFEPDVAVLVDPEAAREARAALARSGSKTRVESGVEALSVAVTGDNVQVVMAAIVGAAGMLPTLAAVRRRQAGTLANKEALVMAGQLLMDEVHRAGTEIIPIDSEHNAIFSNACRGATWPGDAARGVTRVILTASGGPFRVTDMSLLPHVYPGRGVQSSEVENWAARYPSTRRTLMNKGLEVIEADPVVRLSRVACFGGRASSKPGATRWSNTPMARCWRSSGRPDMRTYRICPGRWRGRSVLFPVYNRST